MVLDRGGEYWDKVAIKTWLVIEQGRFDMMAKLATSGTEVTSYKQGTT